MLAYPTDKPSYARLCRLLTLGKGRGEKGSFTLSWADLAAGGEGLLLALLPDMPESGLDCRTSSPAFARAAPSTTPVTAASASPTAI